MGAELLIAGCTAVAVAVTDLVARPAVREAGAGLLVPVLLLAAVCCLVLIYRRARQLRRRRAGAGAGAGQVNAGQATAGQAVGGPCDGQQLALPAGLPVPAEFWLAQGAAKEDPLHRYLLERPPADPCALPSRPGSALSIPEQGLTVLDWGYSRCGHLAR